MLPRNSKPLGVGLGRRAGEHKCQGWSARYSLLDCSRYNQAPPQTSVRLSKVLERSYHSGLDPYIDTNLITFKVQSHTASNNPKLSISTINEHFKFEVELYNALEVSYLLDTLLRDVSRYLARKLLATVWPFTKFSAVLFSTLISIGF